MQTLHIHPDNPQARLLTQAAATLRRGGVIAYPTDSCYALGCMMGDKAAMDRVIKIRHLDGGHHFTLVCRDLSEISTYARFGTAEFRLMKGLTPGPYTFILNATREVPKRLQHARRKTIGIRVPDHPVVNQLLDILGEPLMSVTLIFADDQLPLNDPDEICERLARRVDVFIDSGPCGHEPTSVIDCTGEVPHVVRHGKGELSFLEN